MDNVLLATQDDVKKILGRPLSAEDSARLPAILTKLSELFRLEARRNFTPGRATVRRKVNGGSVWLPQSPVTQIHSVTTMEGVSLPYQQTGRWVYLQGVGSHEMVLVDYSYGSEDVPQLVVQTIADAARQILLIDPKALAGHSQTSQGATPYSESTTYATWAQGGTTRLSSEDRRIAQSFRAKMPNVWVTEA